MSFLINPFVFAAAGDFESIATVTVGSGGAANIEFTSIPGTYQHLQMRYIFRSAGSNAESASFYLNGDNSNTYAYHHLRGNGGAAQAYGSANEFPDTPNFPHSGQLANTFGAGVIDLLDYASTSKNKVVRAFGGRDTNTEGLVGLVSHLRNNTAAITNIKIVPRNGNSFAEHSTAALYGIKA